MSGGNYEVSSSYSEGKSSNSNENSRLSSVGENFSNSESDDSNYYIKSETSEVISASSLNDHSSNSSYYKKGERKRGQFSSNEVDDVENGKEPLCNRKRRVLWYTVISSVILVLFFFGLGLGILIGVVTLGIKYNLDREQLNRSPFSQSSGERIVGYTDGVSSWVLRTTSDPYSLSLDHPDGVLFFPIGIEENENYYECTLEVEIEESDDGTLTLSRRSETEISSTSRTFRRGDGSLLVLALGMIVAYSAAMAVFFAYKHLKYKAFRYNIEKKEEEILKLLEEADDLSKYKDLINCEKIAKIEEKLSEDKYKRLVCFGDCIGKEKQRRTKPGKKKDTYNTIYTLKKLLYCRINEVDLLDHAYETMKRSKQISRSHFVEECRGGFEGDKNFEFLEVANVDCEERVPQLEYFEINVCRM